MDGTEDLYNLPILIEDAASMLRKNVSRNERPYTIDAVKFNNRMVDEWKECVLKRMANSNGTVKSGRVAQSWLLFEEGRTIYSYMKLKEEGLIPDIDPKVIQFWRDFFQDLEVVEMKKYGWGVVAKGWGILSNYIQDHFVQQKWERLYSRSEDPFFWEEHHSDIADLLQGKPHPFWREDELRDIQQKVTSVLSVVVKPSD